MNWFKIIATFVSFVALGASYILIFPEKVNLCVLGQTNCIFGGYEFTIGQPLFNLSFAFFVASLLFFFVSSRVFYRWLLVAIPYLALSAYAIYKAPINHQSIFLLDPTKLDISKFSAILFFGLSVIYVAISFWLEKRKRKASGTLR